MRIWDIPVRKLCRKHLLAEHAELHAVWAILTKNLKGYSKHPEVLRWKHKLGALYKRHEQQIAELRKRGYAHKSRLSRKPASCSRQTKFIDLPHRQLQILKSKKCGCKV